MHGETIKNGYQAVSSSICPSVRNYKRGSHWTDLCEIWYWGLT